MLAYTIFKAYEYGLDIQSDKNKYVFLFFFYLFLIFKNFVLRYSWLIYSGESLGLQGDPTSQS